LGLAKQRASGSPPSKVTVANAHLTTSRGRPQTLRERFSKGEVGDSEDLQRILALPRRSRPEGEEMNAIVNMMTFKLKKPQGTQTLRDLQAWTLWEMPQVGGGLAPLATGAGKTLLGMLMPMVFPRIVQADGSTRPLRAVLFIPPDLRAQFAHDWEVYGKHWKLPNLAGGKYFTEGQPNLHVVAYSELSHSKSTALLEQIQPDLIMGDEIGSLRNFTSARTVRFRRFMGMFPNSWVCGWDASLLSDSIMDFWHLLAFALDAGSPLPLDESELKKWASALDPQTSTENYFMPGELKRLCDENESIRSGFRRRVIETRGVIASEHNALGIPLVFTQRHPPKMPEVIRERLKMLRRKPADGGWLRPDGEVLSEMAQVVACARQLALGFFLRWRYPRGESPEVIDEWFERRQHWNRELRGQLYSPQVHMDSPQLCENAAKRWYDGGCTGCARGPAEQHEVGCREVTTHPLWPAQTYLAWRAVKYTVKHETQAIWESDWLLQDAAEWGRAAPGIVWVDHPEFGHKLSKLTGFRYFGGGDEANEEILTVDGAESIICSMYANKRGKNLQMFSRNLLTSFPASNDMVDQVVGRTYRSKQSAPQVDVDYYLHTPEAENAFEKAHIRASWLQEMMGTEQKLCFGKMA